MKGTIYLIALIIMLAGKKAYSAGDDKCNLTMFEVTCLIDGKDSLSLLQEFSIVLPNETIFHPAYIDSIGRRFYYFDDRFSKGRILVKLLGRSFYFYEIDFERGFYRFEVGYLTSMKLLQKKYDDTAMAKLKRSYPYETELHINYWDGLYFAPGTKQQIATCFEMTPERLRDSFIYIAVYTNHCSMRHEPDNLNGFTSWEGLKYEFGKYHEYTSMMDYENNRKKKEENKRNRK